MSLILEFARTEQGGDPYAFRLDRLNYLVRSADGGFETAELHWDEALLSALDAVRKPRPHPGVVQRLGETLRRFLQPAGWNLHEAQILQAVRSQRRVILTLRSAAAELYALPWELITLKGPGQHIAELPNVLVRYEWPATKTTPPSRALPPSDGRILLCWSAADGAVPAAEHIEAIQRACSSFNPERDVLPLASLKRLDEVLHAAQRTGPPIAVLHLLCHGGPIGDTFGLALHGEQGGERVVVDAGRLRQVLAPYAAMVRVVLLFACDSGNGGTLGNQLGSVAQALHRAGLAHVVASRYPLSVSGSIRLSETIYSELLLNGKSLEESMLVARQRLAQDAAQLDWVSLQFYSRLDDGCETRPLQISKAVNTRPQADVAQVRSAPEPSPRSARPWVSGLLAAMGLLGSVGAGILLDRYLRHSISMLPSSTTGRDMAQLAESDLAPKHPSAPPAIAEPPTPASHDAAKEIAVSPSAGKTSALLADKEKKLTPAIEAQNSRKLPQPRLRPPVSPLQANISQEELSIQTMRSRILEIENCIRETDETLAQISPNTDWRKGEDGNQRTRLIESKCHVKSINTLESKRLYLESEIKKSMQRLTFLKSQQLKTKIKSIRK